ncbi:MAG: LysM peptidoglycan-binding domain-containing protein [Gallionellaceae bacterium]|nr:MAG: LysM peptidoglycan-binding domain-containing protein [Gallionellaceae bacterium]
MIVSDAKNRSTGKPVTHRALLLCAAIMLAGCAAPTARRAPIVERGVEMRKPAASVAAPVPAKKTVVTNGATQVYVVQKGDTMYSIAFVHGADYRDVAELNGIDNPSAIQIGQQLRIPVSGATRIAESKSSLPPVTASSGGMKTQPKAGKIPYSEKALVQAEKMQGEQKEVAAATDADDEEDLEWGMPSSGKVIADFSESANRKGVDIAGKRGQPVVASAPGKVVYSGSGLRGYGKLVIIKHNKAFLSAYAHNDQVLVKEGQSVSKGQKIGEMGNTDADQVKLHFEIRKFGKPVDPAQYLPLIKS